MIDKTAYYKAQEQEVKEFERFALFGCLIFLAVMAVSIVIGVIIIELNLFQC